MNQEQTIKFLKIGIPLFFAAGIFLNILADNRERKYAFSGIVQVVSYNIKGTPDVKIKGVDYVLTYTGWGFEHKIETGDSLIKSSNTMIIKLIKHKTGEIIIFK